MANDQKAEDLLNLALDTPYEMRERSKQLDVGYDRESEYLGAYREIFRKLKGAAFWGFRGWRWWSL